MSSTADVIADRHRYDHDHRTLVSSTQEVHLQHLCRELLLTLGYDPEDAELSDTPRRWAAWWMEVMSVDDAPMTTFDTCQSPEAVAVEGIQTWSVCKHHLLPFSMSVSIAYRPVGRLLGLSKFVRITREVSTGLNVQEDVTELIADRICEATGASDVCVIAIGRHLCMEARGVKASARTRTVATRGDAPHVLFADYAPAGQSRQAGPESW
jgi:GTP cyclohydrolase I